MQCGEPEEVYEQPTEPFVADFIGISNLIEGTVAERRPRAHRQWHRACRRPSRTTAPPATSCGSPVRPEKIAIDELEDGMVRLDGVVQQRVYLGMSTQLTVSVGEGARLVAVEQQTYRASSEDRWEPGTKVKVGWHPEHCLVLR